MDEPSAAIKAARARLKDKFKKTARLNTRFPLPLCCVPANMKFRGDRSIAAGRACTHRMANARAFPRAQFGSRRR